MCPPPPLTQPSHDGHPGGGCPASWCNQCSNEEYCLCPLGSWVRISLGYIEGAELQSRSVYIYSIQLNEEKHRTSAVPSGTSTPPALLTAGHRGVCPQVPTLTWCSPAFSFCQSSRYEVVFGSILSLSWTVHKFKHLLRSTGFLSHKLAVHML